MTRVTESENSEEIEHRCVMTSMVENADAFNWVIGPASRCVLHIGEETRIAGLLQRAVVALAKQGPLLDLARQRIRDAKMQVGPVDRLIAEQRTLEGWAKGLIDDDFDPINRHGIIGLWVAVEVAVEDTVTLILTKEPSTLSLVIAAGIKLPKSMSSPPTESDAQRVFHRLEQLAREGRSVAEAYCYLLSILEVMVEVSPEVSGTLAELNYVRNCLLHRGGIIDSQAKAEAPNLGLALGARIRVPAARYLHYFDAVGQFAKALLSGVIRSRYVRVRPAQH